MLTLQEAAQHFGRSVKRVTGGIMSTIWTNGWTLSRTATVTQTRSLQDSATMTFVRVKGFQIFADRHGRMRCYHRRTKTPVDLTKAPLGSTEFFAECARLAEAGRLQLPPKPGTLGMLIADYNAHPAFTDLADHTRSDYQRIFDYLQPIAGTALARFDAPLVVRIRDKAAEGGKRRFGNYVKAVLSVLFAWGVERGAHGLESRQGRQEYP
jgi:hypothetical protein